MKNRIISFLEIYELLSKNQYGFRPGKSTSGAIYEVTKFIYNELDKHKKVLVVFLGLAKAFNTIDHNILTNIFPGIGIKIIVLTGLKVI